MPNSFWSLAMTKVIFTKKIAVSSLFLFLLLALLPIVDNFTGALFKLKIMSEGAIGSPSQIARFGLFILVIVCLDKLRFHSPMKIILILACYLFFVESFLALFHMHLKAFLYGLVFSIKLLFAVGCYYFIGHWISKDQRRTQIVIKHLVNYGLLIAALVLIAYFSGFHIFQL